MARVLVLALGALSLTWSAGCVYWPHQQQRSPELQGVLLREGVPVPDVAVRLHVNPGPAALGHCVGNEKARTDTSGRFVVPHSEEFAYFIVLGDRRDVWQLCFELPDEEKAIWTGTGWWGGPKVQRLSCEVGAPQPKRPWVLPATPPPDDAKTAPDVQAPGCRELPPP